MRTLFAIAIVLPLAACGLQTSPSVHGIEFPSCNVSPDDPRCGYAPDAGSVGSGPPFIAAPPEFIAGVAASGTQVAVLVALGGGASAVFSMDPTTGARTLLSGTLADGTSRGAGVALASATSIAVETDGSIDVATSTAVIHIVPSTGDRTVLLDVSTPLSCPPTSAPLQADLSSGIAASPRGLLLFSHSMMPMLSAVVAVTSAGCTTVSSDGPSGVGSGPAISFIAGHFVVGDGSLFWFDYASRLASIDLATGNRALTAIDNQSMVPSGWLFQNQALAFESGDVLAIVNTHDLLSVHVASGVQSDFGYASYFAATVNGIAPHPTGWPLLIVAEVNGIRLLNLANGRGFWLSR